MAPVQKTATTHKADSDISVPLEGPVSLLWAYQLRREHALLLNRVDNLADIIRNEDGASLTKSLGHDLKTAGGRITATEKDLDSQRFDLQAIRAKVYSGDEAISEVQLRLAQNEDQYKERMVSVVAEQARMSTTIDQIKANVEANIDFRMKNQQEQICLLESKIVELESRVMELVAREVTVVKDSVEDIPSPDFRKPHLIHNRKVSKKVYKPCHKAFSHANDLLQDIQEQEDSNMLTLQPLQRDETSATEFDLDAGVATMSYARHLCGRTTAEESMAMLPELPSLEYHQTLRADDHISLRQDHTQSWDEYLQEGQDIVVSSPKRKEGAIVDAFVAGVVNPVLRADCERWLDERVWIWKNVEAFAAHCNFSKQRPELSSTAEPDPRPQRAGKRKALPRVANSHAVIKKVSPLLKNQGRHTAEPRVLVQSPEPDRIRRSQRIAMKNDATTQQAGNAHQAALARRRNALSAKRGEEQSQQAQNQLEKMTNAPKHALVKSTVDRSVRPARTIITKPVQTVRPEKAGARHQQVRPAQAKGLAELGEITMPVEPKQVDKPDMHLNGILDTNFHANARKMQESKPKDDLMLHHDALMANMGERDKTFDKSTCRKAKLQKLHDTSDNITPSTPTPLNSVTAASGPSYTEAVGYPAGPYKTPEHGMLVGRTPYKRKLELSEQEQVANMKRARLAKKKRGPPPPIPILPSSDTE